VTIQENQAGFCDVDGSVDSDNGGFYANGTGTEGMYVNSYTT
jgi:hypothetical protein